MALTKNRPKRTSDYVKLPKECSHCQKCGGPIPEDRRSDARYCSSQCRAAAEKKRYKDRNPEYVQRQNSLVRKWRHLKEYGHTDFIDRPELNHKDRFALARSLGFRSMLEYNIAKQLTEAGVGFKYESMTISYIKHPLPLEEDEPYETWTGTDTNSGAT